jgi:hypothetical protein
MDGSESLKRRRGGQRQRLAQAEEEEKASIGQSQLFLYLLQMFAWGHLSPQQIQHIAALACKDMEALQPNGSMFSDLHGLASLGFQGLYVNKMHSELMTKYGGLSKITHSTSANLVFKEPYGMKEQCFLLPHEFFAELFHSYPTHWQRHVVPDEESLGSFWSSVAHHPQMLDHPMKGKKDWGRFAAPVGLHGDGVPVTGKGKSWCKTMTLFSWTSLLSSGNTKDRMFCIWGCFDRLCKSGDCDGTLHQFFTILAWSFYWLFLGVWPNKAWNSDEPYPANSEDAKRAGKPLANGFFGVLWAIMGDLDYFYGVLGLPRFSSATNPCALCKCTSAGPLSWTDNRADALWMSNLWSAKDWLAWPNRSKCPLFSIPGVSCLTVALDYMHCKYLGMDQYMFGSILRLLVYHCLSVGTPQENLNQLWLEIKAYYRTHRTPVRFMYLNKLSMFIRKNKTHKLRGKAAEIKHFGKALLWLWSRHMNNALRLHKQILLLLKLNVKMETILTKCKADYAIPAADAAVFKQCAFDMAQLNSQLADHFMEDDCNAFQVTSKLHMVLHSALMAEHLNPRVVWCFTGEDMMKHYQHLAGSCVKGLKGPAAHKKMMTHYKLAMHLQMQK